MQTNPSVPPVQSTPPPLQTPPPVPHSPVVHPSIPPKPNPALPGAIDIQKLVHRYGKFDAVNGLSLRVEKGQCYGFFGRNGAGKTTTIKCLLNLIRPASGAVRVFGQDPRYREVEVKSRIAYVPDFVAFYPWMSVREALDYLASFRKHWNRQIESELLNRFQLDPAKPTQGLSKGQRTQLALIGAISAEPEMLILDEPTSGLDPLVRREFIQTVIGTYQNAAPGQRTVFVSTHLISEFEGLIDRFTIINQGKEVLTADADHARATHTRIRARFDQDAPAAAVPADAKRVKREGRLLEFVAVGSPEAALAAVRAHNPAALDTESLSLEEIFLVTVQPEGTLA